MCDSVFARYVRPDGPSSRSESVSPSCVCALRNRVRFFPDSPDRCIEVGCAGAACCRPLADAPHDAALSMLRRGAAFSCGCGNGLRPGSSGTGRCSLPDGLFSRSTAVFGCSTDRNRVFSYFCPDTPAAGPRRSRPDRQRACTAERNTANIKTSEMRYFIELSYNGAAYCGWQRQPDQPSVQQTLERGLPPCCASRSK